MENTEEPPKASPRRDVIIATYMAFFISRKHIGQIFFPLNILSSLASPQYRQAGMYFLTKIISWSKNITSRLYLQSKDTSKWFYHIGSTFTLPLSR